MCIELNSPMPCCWGMEGSLQCYHGSTTDMSQFDIEFILIFYSLQYR